MQDEQALARLNQAIFEAENRGDREWLAGILAPGFVLQRADGTVDGRDDFLRKVTAGGDRAGRLEQPIALLGQRAIVKSIVTTGGRTIHNLQIFVRRDGAWKILAWVNERI